MRKWLSVLVLWPLLGMAQDVPSVPELAAKPEIHHWRADGVENYAHILPPGQDAYSYEPTPQNQQQSATAESQRRVQAYQQQLELLQQKRALESGVSVDILKRIEAQR